MDLELVYFLTEENGSGHKTCGHLGHQLLCITVLPLRHPCLLTPNGTWWYEVQVSRNFILRIMTVEKN